MVTLDERDRQVLDLLKKSCPELFKLGDVELFQMFYCPISIVVADVKEYIVDEYDSVELLVLRLFSAGLKSVEDICALTGIDDALVRKLLYAEMYTYGHIDPETEELTQAGIETLMMNQDPANLFQHALYDVKRELQVDAVTGTLIRANAEIFKRRMFPLRDTLKPYILPLDAVVIDETLEREIRERLDLYIKKGILAEGNTVKSIGRFSSKEVRYRTAYCVLMENFDYPFIAIKFFQRNESGSKEVVMPIAIAESDFAKLGISMDECGYIVRADEYFDYLKDSIDSIVMSQETSEEELLVSEKDEDDWDDVPDGFDEEVWDDMPDEFDYDWEDTPEEIDEDDWEDMPGELNDIDADNDADQILTEE